MSYRYDGNGTLIKRTDAGGTLTIYIGGVYEKTGSAVVKYYSAFGKTIARRDVPNPSTPAGTLQFLPHDQIGNTYAAVSPT